MRGRGTASIVASPVLVGAVTTLIVIVSVFLAYNANPGLPFVPTYNLKAELPAGSNLVPGNEVRLGGFRVGIVDKINPGTGVVTPATGQPAPGVAKGATQGIAIVKMKLDKSVQPLPIDTHVLVRPRSALGLKYIELTPGRSKQTYRDGDTIKLRFATAPVEFDDLLNTFDAKTRQNSQDALQGYGDAFAGRGQDTNLAIQGLAPFFRYLAPVMANLSDPRTRLNEFFRQIGRTSAQVAPVARIQAELFANMADTFAAIGHNPAALQATIEKNPPTEDTAIRSFRIQRPFLADFADLSRRLRPAAQVLPSALPKLNAAFRVGTPVLRRSVILNRNTEKVWKALDFLVQAPTTLLGLKDLTALVKFAGPLFTYIGPFQTVCNYATSFIDTLGAHISEGTQNGTAERVLVKGTDQSKTDNRLGDFADRPADVPSNVDPTGLRTTAPGPSNEAIYVLHGQPYPPAIDAQGNADCVVGQFGYPDGPLVDRPGRYPARTGTREPSGSDPGTFNSWSRAFAGGSHVVVANDPPFLFGPTFNGVKSLQSVDPQLKKDGFNP